MINTPNRSGIWFGNTIRIMLVVCILLLINFVLVAQDANYYEAEKALKTGRWHQAINYAVEIRENAKIHETIRAEAWLISARAHSQLHELADGLRCYLRALSILKKSNDEIRLSRIYTEIGKVYLGADMSKTALGYFMQAQLLTQKSPELYLLLPEYIGDTQAQFAKAESYTEALELYDEILGEYRAEKDTTAILRIIRKMVNCHENLEDYGAAIQQESELLRLYSTQKDTAGLALTFNNLGYYHQHLKRYDTALLYFEQSLGIFRKYRLKDYDEVATLVNMGVVHQNTGNYDKSLIYMLKALELVKQKKDPVQLSQIHDLVSAIYFYLGDYHNARVYNEKALEIAQKANHKIALRDSYKTASDIATGLEDYKTAMEYSRLYLALRDSLLVEERLQQRELLDLQADIEETAKKTALILADQEVKDLEYQRIEMEAEKQKQEFELLKEREARIRANQERQKSENEQTRLALELAKRQLDADRKNRAIAELEKRQAQDALALKQKELEKQRKNREIAELNQRQKFLEREQELQNKTIAEQEAKKQFLIGIIVLAGLIMFVMLWAYRKLKDKNRQIQRQSYELEARKNEIETQNEEMQQQQEEIIAQRDTLARTNDKLNSTNSALNKAYGDIRSSVQYAERIQTAMLPTLVSIQKTFPESFVLYKPRDIVSGDFYWFEQIDNKAIFTAADCTGHGVPGAFMSLIGNDLLNEIVSARKITEPEKILQELHLGVVKSLKQEQNQIRDGMDIALCSVDLENLVLEFAGAKNPLIYIRNGEMQKIKGDTMPIGGSEKEGERIFTKHSFSINNHAEHTFYIYSDGYQDQFGGPKGKKFMSKRFRNLLLEIHQKPMPEQERILDQTINEWMNGYEQIDDILVIGFKIWG